MTTTKTSTTHPAWCHPAYCIQVDDFPTEHRRTVERWSSLYGRLQVVGVVLEYGGERPMVELLYPVDEGDARWHPDIDPDEQVWLGVRNSLEPEEARMLARWLVEAADRCEKARTS